MASAVALGAGVLAQSAHAQRSPVRVEREEPVIVRAEYDPRRPPADMPELKPPESGVCKTTFELSASVTYSAERLSRTSARIYVDELDIVTRLRFDIFTIKNAPAKLRAHEEGHRAIGEHYYESAERIATDIGKRLIGATFDGTGADQDAAQQDGFNKVVEEIERAYMALVRAPSASANERFDEITNHGLDPIDENEAIRRAIAGTPPA
ncbi:MAG TPA: hypothetical protein VM692_16370 [Gammaproteobacteria bacterium]|nr:hypothetical protein [Gammaproteobacteria bacterium]